MVKRSLFIFSMLFSVTLQASSSNPNSVIYTGVNNKGVVFFQLAQPINEPGCTGAQLAIPPESDIKEKILSIALTAKTTSSEVTIKTNGCRLNYSG